MYGPAGPQKTPTSPWLSSTNPCLWANLVPSGTPILRLSRTSRDADGRIFEASEDRYLSSIVRFTVSGSGISPDGQYLRAVGG